jgi:UDP-4-amino-4,6-dideoxy-N-acetyl-beta-L-altrosamine N-acetyltransferase
LLKFANLTEADLELVLRWRVSPDVTRFMTTDIEYNLENQKLWFTKIRGDESAKYWKIMLDEKPIGVINLVDIDHIHRRCSVGYYIGDLACRSIGFMIPPYIYNYAFYNLGMHKIYGEVLDGNDNLLKMHKLHGWREVGIFKDHVFKYGKFSDVYIVELLSESWKRLLPRFGRFVGDFEESN